MCIIKLNKLIRPNLKIGLALNLLWKWLEIGRLKKSKNTKFNNWTNELIWRTHPKEFWGVGLTESISNRDPPTHPLRTWTLNMWTCYWELGWELEGTIWNLLLKNITNNHWELGGNLMEPYGTHWEHPIPHPPKKN